MSYSKKEIGKMGENLASNYLEGLGYEIIKRNYFDREGEIDIIAYKNYKIHFVEVKSVYCENGDNIVSDMSYNPAEKVDYKKIRRIVKVAERFLFENSLEEELYQFDLIMIFIYENGFKYKIETIENININ